MLTIFFGPFFKDPRFFHRMSIHSDLPFLSGFSGWPNTAKALQESIDFCFSDGRSRILGLQKIPWQWILNSKIKNQKCFIKKTTRIPLSTSASSFTTGKSWMRWNSFTFLRFIRKLRSQGRPPPPNLDNCTYTGNPSQAGSAWSCTVCTVRTVQSVLMGTLTGHLMNQAECGLDRVLKVPGNQSLGGASDFHGFYFQDPHQVLLGKREKSTHVLGIGRGK